MKEPRTCVVNVAFRERYLPFQERLRKSLVEYAPKIATRLWTDDLPPKSPPHGDPTHYAFKLFAFQHAKENGFERILWLDAGTELRAPIEPLLAEISVREGVLLVADRDPLALHCSDECLEYFRLTREQAGRYKLPGGGIIGIDLTLEKGRHFYEEWWWAFLAGFYKNGDHDHRWDESIFGGLIHRLHLKLLEPGKLWQWDPESQTNCVIRTGYERSADSNR